MKQSRHKMRLIVSAVASSLATMMVIITPQALAHETSTRAHEQKIQELENQLRSIREEINQVKDKAVREEQEVRKIKEDVAREDREIKKVEGYERKHHHMLFFRGGFAHNLQGRNGSSIQSNVAPLGVQEKGDNDGWYVGAGFDYNLTRDVWGLLPKTDVYAELMFEYKKFGTSQGNALANIPTLLVQDTVNPRAVTVSQFTVSAAPKIKFMEGSDFRPWIIPAGFAVHVVSPTTESITYLAPGMMFAAGADYRIWKDFFIGADARYHETFGKTDGVNVSGLTAGAYLGIGF